MHGIELYVRSTLTLTRCPWQSYREPSFLFQVVELHTEIKFRRCAGDPVFRIYRDSVHRSLSIRRWARESLELSHTARRQIHECKYRRWTTHRSCRRCHDRLIRFTVVRHHRNRAGEKYWVGQSNERSERIRVYLRT